MLSGKKDVCITLVFQYTLYLIFVKVWVSLSMGAWYSGSTNDAELYSTMTDRAVY